jgi:hypothetical protein
MVGNNPEAVSLMIGAKGTRGYAIPSTVIPALGQVSEYGVHVPVRLSKEAWYVLQQEVLGSYFANDADGVRPHVLV